MWPQVATVVGMRAVGIRELKDRLSRYLDEVRRGEILLVTDRGTVVAEIRRPSLAASGLTPLEQRLQPYVERGIVSVAAPRDPSIYRMPSFSLPAEEVDRSLDEARGER